MTGTVEITDDTGRSVLVVDRADGRTVFVAGMALWRYVRQVLTERAQLQAELSAIDAAVARRPALAQSTRRANIEHLCAENQRLTDRVAALVGVEAERDREAREHLFWTAEATRLQDTLDRLEGRQA